MGLLQANRNRVMRSVIPHLSYDAREGSRSHPAQAKLLGRSGEALRAVVQSRGEVEHGGQVDRLAGPELERALQVARAHGDEVAVRVDEDVVDLRHRDVDALV